MADASGGDQIDSSPRELDLSIGDISTSPVQLKRVEGRLIYADLARMLLALLFAFLFGATVVLAYLGAQGAHWDTTQKWLQVVLPAETAVLGSAVGFYFGARKDSGP